MSSEREIHFHRKRHFGSVYYWPITAKGVALTFACLLGGLALAWAVLMTGTWLHLSEGLLYWVSLVTGFGGLAAWLLIAHRHSEEQPRHW